MALAFVNVALLVNLCLAATLFVQDSPPTAPVKNSPSSATSIAQDTIPMPKDPAAILDAAAKINGLVGAGPRPWHLKVSYQTFDTKGHSQDSGTYEEFWISDKKYKRSYESSNFSQTDFATDHGLYRSGNQNWPGLLEMMVRTELIEPMPTAMNLHGLELGKNRRSLGKVKLQCVTLKSETIFPTSDVYCFQQDEPILRFASSMGGSNDIVFNDIVVFEGHWLAREVRVIDKSHPHLFLHVDKIEGLTTVNDSDFNPPPDAVRISGGAIAVSEETMKSLVLRQAPPHYPENAKASRVEGTVVMQITVGKDGHVSDVRAISGPEALRKAAIDAARKWEFRPFLVLGDPTEVESKLRIIFSLGP